MKIHLAAALGVAFLAWWFSLAGWELAVLIITVVGVFALELVNTAIENVVDLVSPQQHQLAKAAKDVAAGAVLIFAIGALFIGYILFYHRIFG